MEGRCFLDVDYCQQAKYRQNVAGDVFLSKKENEGRRVISALVDGLGSGVEANVLASLTATMALETIIGRIDTRRAAEIIMDALPVCRQRKVSYSAFSLIDTDTNGNTRVISHGSPPFLLVRNGLCVSVETSEISHSRWKGRCLQVAQFQTQMEDRIVFFSDGISQSGIGTRPMPLGWGIDRVREFVQVKVERDSELSARNLSQSLVQKAIHNDGAVAGDDITCGVIYFRYPRILRVLTGPPYDMSRDPEFAQLVVDVKGRTIVCGGTTGNIVARELRRRTMMDLTDVDPEVPNTSRMEGVDLVTEGCLTLGKVAEILETGDRQGRVNGATRMVDLLLQSDIIEIVMGTRINEAHQNPKLPVELDIRRNVIKKIRHLLEQKYLKATTLAYF